MSYLVERLRQVIRLGGQALHVPPLLLRLLCLGGRGLPALPAHRCSLLGRCERLGIGLPLRKGGIDVGSLGTGTVGVRLTSYSCKEKQNALTQCPACEKLLRLLAAEGRLLPANTVHQQCLCNTVHLLDTCATVGQQKECRR